MISFPHSREGPLRSGLETNAVAGYFRLRPSGFGGPAGALAKAGSCHCRSLKSASLNRPAPWTRMSSRKRSAAAGRFKEFPGGHRSRAIPVPIPNTEVKPATADGTAGAALWESRSLPGIYRAEKPRLGNQDGAFPLYGSSAHIRRQSAQGHDKAWPSRFVSVLATTVLIPQSRFVRGGRGATPVPSLSIFLVFKL